MNIKDLKNKSLEEITELVSKSSVEDIAKIIKELEINQPQYGLYWEKKDTEVIEKELYKDSYPYLSECEELKILNDENTKHNILIEGDNYHALKLLQYTHTGKVDVIYIDPPYNTGKKDFVYNDKYVEKEDSYRHSKWINFIVCRLELAKELLSDEGLLLISIDENEYAQLKMVCDSIFGEENYVENFIWVKNSTKNNSKTTSTNHEYILCYAKHIDKIKANCEVFRIKKQGYDEVMSLKNNFLKNEAKYFDNPKQELQNRIRSLYKDNPHFKGISSYKYVDEQYNIYASSDNSAPGSGGKQFVVLHPSTKKPCKIPSRGWRFTEEEFYKRMEDGRILFGKDENTVPRHKKLLEHSETDVMKSLIFNNDDGEKDLKKIFSLNESPFNNPKPMSLLKYLLKGVSSKYSICLDFFAGSGTFGHAVLDLNKEDGGNRQFILCTNNENNICEEVTYQRLDNVINGYTTTNNKYVNGLGGNLDYYKINFFEKENLEEDDYRKFVESKGNYTVIDNIIKVKEDLYDCVFVNEAYRIYKNNNKIIGVFTKNITDRRRKNMLEYFKDTIFNNYEKKIYIYGNKKSLSSTCSSFFDGIKSEIIPIDLIEILKKKPE